MSQSKYWCFTLNNYNENEETAIASTFTDPEEDPLLVYVVYGRETGENGTRHLQGYLELSKRQRLTGVRRLPGLQRAHFEPRRGSASQAIAYCRKDGEVVTFGERVPIEQGRRNDLQALKETLDSGVALSTVADEHFGSFLRYEKSIRSYSNLRRPSRTWKTEIVVYWGPTGTGKTRRAMELSNGNAWIYSSDGWFDGYDGDENVIFDDFGGHEFKLTYLLKLLDRYPMRVRVKGGFVSWVPRKIFITSNHRPEDWYQNASHLHREALMRRLETIEEMAQPFYDDIIQ